MKHQFYLALSLILLSESVLSAQAQESVCKSALTGWEISAIPERSMGKPLGVFKLKARFDADFDPVLIDLNGPRIRPKVDANLINQIDQVKMAVPGWHGFHNIIPGAGSAAGH